MVGLKPRAEGAGQADGGDTGSSHPYFCSAIDQIQVAHQLGNSRDHLAGQASAHPGQLITVSCQYLFSKFTDGEVFEAGIDGDIEAIHNNARHLILFIGNRRMLIYIADC